jgi:tetratricopeptide (TPR) repeat protein
MLSNKFLSFLLIIPLFASGAVAEDLPQAEKLFLRGDWVKAIAALKDAANADPSEKNKKMLADAYFYRGDLDESLKVWKEMASEEDSEVSIVLIEAIKKGRAGELGDKIGEYGENRRFLRGLGIAHINEGEDEAALDYFNAAVNSDPGDYMSYFYIGSIYENTEDFDNAIAAYKKSISINPHYAQALNNLGYCYKEKQYYTYAIDYYKKAIAEMPENEGFHYNIGNVYMQKDDLENASGSYRKAVELNPSFAKPHYNLGRIYANKEMYKEAVREFDLYIKYWSPGLSPLDVPHPDVVEKEIIEIEHHMIELEEERRLEEEAARKAGGVR